MVSTATSARVRRRGDDPFYRRGWMAEPVIRGESSSTRAGVAMRTAAWYGDRRIHLELPESWEASVFRPATGPALADHELCERLGAPVDQRPIRERCSAATRPLIIVDDLNRPTPAARFLPLLLRQFTDAGIKQRDISILVG